MKNRVPPKAERLPASKQRRLDALLEKNSEGTITPRETRLLQELVAEAERLMIANAKRLARFSASERGGRRQHAVPVTLWIKPGGNPR